MTWTTRIGGPQPVPSRPKDSDNEKWRRKGVTKGFKPIGISIDSYASSLKGYANLVNKLGG